MAEQTTNESAQARQFNAPVIHRVDLQSFPPALQPPATGNWVLTAQAGVLVWEAITDC